MNTIQVKNNTGTNLIVRMTITLMNDGWAFVIDEDRIKKAYHQEDNIHVHFSNSGELKNWLIEKSLDY